MRFYVISFVFLTITLCSGQYTPRPDLRHGLSERIGNFSIEFLYHASKAQGKPTNLVLSPFTIWTVLAVTAEGAVGDTLTEINNIIRLTVNNRERVRGEYKSIAQYLQAKTNSVELAKINVIFIDQNFLPQSDFRDIAKSEYDADMIALDFTQSDDAASVVNRVISNVTHGRIPKLVEAGSFANSKMFLTSAVYFKGRWTVPFDPKQTEQQPFYDNDGNKIGVVNMMYNKFTYPFANINELKARVLELPYGSENRLSMLIMLPHPGVSVEDMFYNFNNITVDKMFEELKIAREQYGDDEVHCNIPRFKIESNLDLTSILKDRLGVVDLFDPVRARLNNVARINLYVSRIIHKAEIEVTEEGTTASAATASEFANRFGTIRFEANRPFSYLIIEKTTNSIVFGGIYQVPVLY